MALTDSEIESLRLHLGYGNIDVGAYPYTPDGFYELFRGVIAPNLTGDTETTATTAIAAKSTTTVTPVSMTGIVSKAQLVIDVGDDTEVVFVKSVTGSTFTAYFVKAHLSSGYVVALMGGHARLRMLLQRADQAWGIVTNPTAVTAGAIKQIDKGDVEWFEAKGSATETSPLGRYKAIVEQIASLVRVAPEWASSRGPQSLEAY